METAQSSRQRKRGAGGLPFGERLRVHGWASGWKNKTLSWTKSRDSWSQRALCCFKGTAHIPRNLLAVVSLPAARTHTLPRTHVHLHHNRLMLKVSDELLSFLCAACFPISALCLYPTMQRAIVTVPWNQEVSSACKTYSGTELFLQPNCMLIYLVVPSCYPIYHLSNRIFVLLFTLIFCLKLFNLIILYCYFYF